MVPLPRLDVSLRVTPEGLIGRRVRVFWPLDDAWFLGTVDSYDPATLRHKVCCVGQQLHHIWLHVVASPFHFWHCVAVVHWDTTLDALVRTLQLGCNSSWLCHGDLAGNTLNVQATGAS